MLLGHPHRNAIELTKLVANVHKDDAGLAGPSLSIALLEASSGFVPTARRIPDEHGLWRLHGAGRL